MDEQGSHTKYELNLCCPYQEVGCPIYSLSANGSQNEGIQGLRPTGLLTQESDVRKASDVRRLGTVRSSGRARKSVDSALSWARRTSGEGRLSGASGLSGRPEVVGRS